MAAQAPAAQPAAAPAPAFTKWQCCNCENGPVKRATQTKCVSCSHEVCDTCKKDDAIPPPLGTTAALVRVRARARARALAADPAIWSSSTSLRAASHSRGRARAAHDARLTSRPSMAGWWRCSECRNINNPTLAPSRCSICGHGKCRYCTAA